MKFAVCSLNHRVSPLIQQTKEIILVTAKKNKDILLNEIRVKFNTINDLVSLLKSLKIKIVICGGIKEEHFFLFKDNKIKVITNVIGDVEDIVRQIDSEFLKMI